MKAIKFKRLTIISAALLLHSAAYSQIPKGERPKFPEYIGAFDVKENLSEEEIKALKPKVVFMDEKNQITNVEEHDLAQMITDVQNVE